MDILSLAVGFLVGAATGAAGSYLADKFTDRRRQKAQIKKQNRLRKDIEAKFPSAGSKGSGVKGVTRVKGVRSCFVHPVLLRWSPTPSKLMETERTTA